MKILCTFILFLLASTVEAETNNKYLFTIGTDKEIVIDNIFKESDIKLLNENVEFTRYQATFSPLGIIAHRYRYIFEKGKIALVAHFSSSWVGPKEEYLTKEIIDKGNSINSDYLNQLIKINKAKKINRKGDTDIYSFEKQGHNGRIFINNDRFISGEIIIWNKDLQFELGDPINEKYWFGLGHYTNDVENRIKETYTIPFKNGQTYIWSIKTDFDHEKPVKLKVIFPDNSMSIPQGAEFNSKENSMIFPMGSYKDHVTLEFEVNNGDPLGLHKMFLIADDETFAGVSYTVGKGEIN